MTVTTASGAHAVPSGSRPAESGGGRFLVGLAFALPVSVVLWGLLLGVAYVVYRLLG